ncbi:MAG: RNA polymerase sigma factor [Anaerovoracaceae bacterium]
MDFAKFTPGIRREITILFKMYSKAIKAIANEVLNDEALSDDCLQEVMLKLAKNLDNIGEYGSPRAKAYIFRITKNHAIDIWRKRSKGDIAQGLTPNGTPYGTECREDNKRTVGRYGYDESLDKYLEKLDETDRAIVGMKYDFGMQHREIAKVLGKTITSVDKRSERVKTKVKNFVMEGIDNEEEYI